jgi:hypothetical protein
MKMFPAHLSRKLAAAQTACRLAEGKVSLTVRLILPK